VLLGFELTFIVVKKTRVKVIGDRKSRKVRRVLICAGY
jgi:hypothetical protein